MKRQYKFKIKVATILGLTTLFAFANVARAEDRTSVLGNSSVLWNLTPTQAKQADELIAAALQRAATSQIEIDGTRRQITGLFLEPSPDQKAILDIQNRQDAIKARRDEDLLQTNLTVRQLLSPEQRQWLGIPRAADVLSGIELSQAQLKKYRELMQPYLLATLTAAKQRANLELDQTILLQEMDLVHGCHAMSLDEPALIANQKQVSALDSGLARKRTQVEIELHNLLTETQRKQLASSAKIVLPDPVESKLQNESTTVFAPPEQVFKRVTLTNEQKDRYNSQMSKFMADLDQGKKLRDKLVAERNKLLNSPALDQSALVNNQDRINQIDEQRAVSKVTQIAKTRDVLTKEQRHDAYNRHHPKIWSDTGIDAEQDKKIMAIHMKIEESDREGQRKMGEITAEIRQLFFEPTSNDREIISAQKNFDRVEAETIHKQLECLFEGRAVLTEVQRVKLVQLMRAEN
jgi:Spy/CpxP family protein refolding chaperone